MMAVMMARKSKTRRAGAPVTLPAKQVLVPGIFVDANGQPFEVRPEDMQAFLDGTQDLIRNGYRILGWPDHENEDVREILSRWGSFEIRDARYWSPMDGEWKMGPCIYAVPVAEDEKAAKVIARNDTSPILVWDYPWAGKVFPRAIIRLDHVGQGAIPTEAFKVAASASKAKRYATARKGATMLDALIQSLKDFMENGGAQADAFRGAASAFLQAPDDDSILEQLAARLSQAPGETDPVEPGDEGEPGEPGEMMAPEDLEPPAAEPTEDEEGALTELEDAIEETMLQESSAMTVSAGARKGQVDPWKINLDQAIRAASKMSLRGCGAPLPKTVIDNVRDEFNRYRKPLGPLHALELAKRRLAMTVKISELSAARASSNARTRAAGATKQTRPSTGPKKIQIADVTGKNNPLRHGIKKTSSGSIWD